ncbi:MAG: putative peptidoglycan lipid flippase [Clostridia bacterium]|nr:putative peptidoglycan lipid flippase [Clostridia bacterium]
MNGILKPSPVARLAQAAGLVVAINLLSRILGFVRDAAIAATFGAGPETDAYLVAYTIPYFLQSILGTAFATVLVPVLTAHLVNGEREEGWRVASAVNNWTALMLIFGTILGILAAPWLVKLLAPGFGPETAELARVLIRILFFSLPFMGCGLLLGGILNAGYIFTSPALGPAVSNIVIIITALFFGRRFGIVGLAVGTFLSFVAFFLIQLPDLQRIGFRYRLTLLPGNAEVRQVGRHLGPVILSLSVIQLYLATNRFFASRLAEGSITALEFGIRLVNLPLGVFVAAASTVIFPALAEQAALRRKAEMARLADRGLALVSLASLPAAAGLVILREPLVRLVFERGAFDARATSLTAIAAMYYALGILAQAAHPILTRAFYALQDVRTPLIVGLASVGLNTLLSYFLVGYLGHGGLALANTLAAGVYSLALYLLLRRELPQLDGLRLAEKILKFGLASLLMAAVVYLGARGVTFFVPGQDPVVLGGKTLLLISIGAGSFLLFCRVLRVEEIRVLGTLLASSKQD